MPDDITKDVASSATSGRTTNEEHGVAANINPKHSSSSNTGPPPCLPQPAHLSITAKDKDDHAISDTHVLHRAPAPAPASTVGTLKSQSSQRILHNADQPSTSSSVSFRENIPLKNMSRQRLQQTLQKPSVPNNNDNDNENHEAAQDELSRGSEQQHPASGSSRDQGKGKRKEAERQDGWMRRHFGRFGSLNLENKGSVARDHLALERTFLAWLRTSLSFASIGIAVTQLFRLNSTLQGGQEENDRATTLRHMGKPLGATFLGIAIVVLLIGLNRYYESQNWLLQGKFPASRGSILFLTAIAAALIICSLVIVIVVNPAVV